MKKILHNWYKGGKKIHDCNREAIRIYLLQWFYLINFENHDDNLDSESSSLCACDEGKKKKKKL